MTVFIRTVVRYSLSRLELPLFEKSGTKNF